MFSNLATEIFDPPRVRFCAASTADMKAGGLAIVESDDLLTAPMESATNDLQMLSLPSGFLPLPASSQGLLGLTEGPPTRLLHPTKPESTFCFLSKSAVSDLQHCHEMIPSYAAAAVLCTQLSSVPGASYAPHHGIAAALQLAFAQISRSSQSGKLLNRC